MNKVKQEQRNIKEIIIGKFEQIEVKFNSLAKIILNLNRKNIK